MEATRAVEIIMWVVAGTTLVFVVALGAVLSYHLRHFALNKKMGRYAMTLYIIVSIILLLFLIGLTPAHFA